MSKRIEEAALRMELKELIDKIINEDWNMKIDYTLLEEIMLEWSEDEIYKDVDGYHACTEWLLGTFAGRSFVGKTKKQALKNMCKYFDETKNTDTMVGNILREMCWPNLDMIYQKLYIEGS